MLNSIARQASRIRTVAKQQQLQAIDRRFLETTRHVRHELAFIEQALGPDALSVAQKGQLKLLRSVEQAAETRDRILLRETLRLSPAERELAKQGRETVSGRWAERLDGAHPAILAQPEKQVQETVNRVVDDVFRSGRASKPDVTAERAQGWATIGHVEARTRAAVERDNRGKMYRELFTQGHANASSVVWARTQRSAMLDRAGRIMDRLKAVAPERPFPIETHLFQDRSINAFAAGGGSFGLNQGLFKSVKSDHELAFVLAHELAHDFHRDIPGGSAVARAHREHLGRLQADKAPGSLVREVHEAFSDATMQRARYTMEREADMAAARLVAKAGFDPRQGAEWLGRLHDPRVSEALYRKNGYPSPATRRQTILDMVEREGLFPG
jgi:hypothetical protein